MSISRYMVIYVSLLDVGATAIVLLCAGLLLGAMFLFIRISTDDSEKYNDLKAMVEALFSTPAHLRPSEAAATKEEARASSSTLQSFSEPCPACEQTVTELDSECPSCGLRLL
ncbi:MAG: hypothetical protein ACE3L7_15330 [Candidatus Pristimantibacillus sp.]